MALIDLPMTYVDMALGEPAPRYYILLDETVVSAKDVQSNETLQVNFKTPVYPDYSEFTMDMPFIYQLKSNGVTKDDLTDSYKENITMVKHTPETLAKYINTVRMVLSQDLIRNGIARINFNPEVKYIFQKKTYFFDFEDLSIFNQMQFPQQVDCFDPGQRPELLNLAQFPLYIPCTCNDEYVLFQAQHRAGKDLFQKYVSMIKKYREVMSMLLRAIADWTFTNSQSPKALWITLFGKADQFGSIERIKL